MDGIIDRYGTVLQLFENEPSPTISRLIVRARIPRAAVVACSSMCGHVRILETMALDPLDAVHGANLAAGRGELAALDFFRQRHDTLPSSHGVDGAMRNGYLETVKWCVEYGVPNTVEGTTGAMRNGHLGVLEYAYLHGNLFTAYVDAACIGCHLPVIEWGLDHGLDISRTAIEAVVKRNRLDLLVLISTTDEHKQAVFDAALVHGNLRLAKSAAHGRRVSERVLDTAAGNGHLEILQWVQSRHKQTPGDEGMALAASNGHFAVMDWLWARTRRVPASLVVSPTDDIRLIFWLIDHHRPPTTSDLSRFASWGRTDMIRQCYRHGLMPDHEAADNAAVAGNLDTLKWLVGIGVYPTRHAFDTSSETASVSRWLVDSFGFSPWKL